MGVCHAGSYIRCPKLGPAILYDCVCLFKAIYIFMRISPKQMILMNSHMSGTEHFEYCSFIYLFSYVCMLLHAREY